MNGVNPAPANAVEPARPLVQVRGLKKYFPVREGSLISRTVGHVKAVDVDLPLGVLLLVVAQRCLQLRHQISFNTV